MWTIRTLYVGSIALACGCATTAPEHAVFRDDAPSMSAIYHSAAGQRGVYPHERPIISGSVSYGSEALAGWTRDQATEVFNLFPEGPNPVLLMYVFPHLTGERIGVPGFTTPFRMYANDYYALPGEVD